MRTAVVEYKGEEKLGSVYLVALHEPSGAIVKVHRLVGSNAIGFVVAMWTREARFCNASGNATEGEPFTKQKEARK